MEEKRSWYKKKRYLIPLGVMGLISILVAVSPESTPLQENPLPVVPNQIEAVKSTTVETKIQTAKSAPTTERSCNPNYSGCLMPNASDYDCSGGSGNGPYYTGTIQVIGYDEYDLDRDGDGWGCE